MKKEETKKVNDPIGEYLVNRIKELESERDMILGQMDLVNVELAKHEDKASKFEELQSLFRLENGVICLYDKGGHFQDAVATDFTEFGKYLVELVNLKEKK